MTTLTIHDIKINALHGAVHDVGRMIPIRIGPDEIPRLVNMMFQDAHNCCDELSKYNTVYEFVYTKMKRWGYIASDDKGTEAHY